MVAEVSAYRGAAAREIPPGLDATQVMLEHMLHFRCALYEDYKLYEKFRPTTLGISSSVWRKRLYSTDRKTLMACECCESMGFCSEVYETAREG